jgi:hypothetical protein
VDGDGGWRLGSCYPCVALLRKFRQPSGPAKWRGTPSSSRVAQSASARSRLPGPRVPATGWSGSRCSPGSWSPARPMRSNRAAMGRVLAGRQMPSRAPSASRWCTAVRSTMLCGKNQSKVGLWGRVLGKAARRRTPARARVRKIRTVHITSQITFTSAASAASRASPLVVFGRLARDPLLDIARVCARGTPRPAPHF